MPNNHYIMFLIIGLGNPGKKYENTRHNAGFMALDVFAKRNFFPEFKLSKKFSALISEGSVSNGKVILAKPQTFMNESGKTASALANHYKLSTENILVIHDDLDLPLGKIKISKGSSSAGHKGADSIIKHLKTKDFARFRIGIENRKKELPRTNRGGVSPSGRVLSAAPKPPKTKTKDVEKFVLEKFTKEESAALKDILQKTISTVETYLAQGPEKAMSEYNK